MNYISVKEAAAQWGVTIQMVRCYCQKGMIPQVIQENGGWRIPEGTVRPGTPEPVMLDVLEDTDEYLFARLNRKRPNNSMQKRDYATRRCVDSYN